MRAITYTEDLGDGLIGVGVSQLNVPGHPTERWSLVFHAGQWEVRNADDVLYDRCPGIGRALDALLGREYDEGPLV